MAQRLSIKQLEKRIWLAAQLDAVRGALTNINTAGPRLFGLSDEESDRLDEYMRTARNSLGNALRVAWVDTDAIDAGTEQLASYSTAQAEALHRYANRLAAKHSTDLAGALARMSEFPSRAAASLNASGVRIGPGAVVSWVEDYTR